MEAVVPEEEPAMEPKMVGRSIRMSCSIRGGRSIRRMGRSIRLSRLVLIWLEERSAWVGLTSMWMGLRQELSTTQGGLSPMCLSSVKRGVAEMESMGSLSAAGLSSTPSTVLLRLGCPLRMWRSFRRGLADRGLSGRALTRRWMRLAQMARATRLKKLVGCGRGSVVLWRLHQ
jgi:hypothetical protein